MVPPNYQPMKILITIILVAIVIVSVVYLSNQVPNNQAGDPYIYTCMFDFDCVSATAKGSCFYACEEDCESKEFFYGTCPAINKNSPDVMCIVGKPCYEPQTIKCVGGFCVGK